MAGTKILVVDINSDGISFCGVETEKEAADYRGNFFKRLVRRACEPVKFFPALRDKIFATKPTIIVIGTQQEDVSHSKLHSEFLPRTMKGLGYDLVRSEMLKDVGIDASLLGADRMKPGTLGLITSIYVQSHFAELVTVSKHFGTHYTINGRKCGALCHYLYTTRHRLAFINVSLPDSADIASVKTEQNRSHYNQIIATGNELFMLQCLKEFALNEDPEFKPTSVIIFGDMATSIKTTKTAIEVIQSAQANLSQVIAADSFSETNHLLDITLIEGAITFPPTAGKRRDAPDTCENDWQKMPPRACYAADNDYKILSYRNRIVHAVLETPGVTQLSYESLYLPGNENNGVIAEYQLS